jgi:hypothetical protein
VDIAVPREVPIDRALATLERVGAEWARERGAALETPRAQGIIKLTGNDAVLRLTMRVDPARRFDAESELRRRIREAFDREHWAFSGAS